MNSEKLTYSKTIETEPEHAELLNYLVDRLVIPVMQKRIAQGIMPAAGGGRKKLTPEEELQKILSFGTPQSVDVSLPEQKPNNNNKKVIAQGGLGLNTKELRDLESLLKFGQSSNKPTQEGVTVE